MADNKGPQVNDRAHTKTRCLEDCAIEVTNCAANRSQYEPSNKWRITEFANNAYLNQKKDRYMEYMDLEWQSFELALELTVKYKVDRHELQIESTVGEGMWVTVPYSRSPQTSLIQALVRAAAEGIRGWTFRLIIIDGPDRVPRFIANRQRAAAGPMGKDSAWSGDDDYNDNEYAGYEDGYLGAEDLINTW